MEKKFLQPKKFAELCQKVTEKGTIKVAKHLLIYKCELKVNCITSHIVARQCKRKSHSIVIKAEIERKLIDLKCDKIHKNALLITRCKLLYLDFVDTYQGHYSM